MMNKEFLGGFLVSLCFASSGLADEGVLKTSKRDELATTMILNELSEKGYSGDSIKLDFETPASVVLKLYKIAGGQASLVQTSKPTTPSRSFELGFVIRPNGKGQREVTFIFDDHIIQTKAVGTYLANEEGKAHPIPMKVHSQVFSMGSIRSKGEAAVFHSYGGRSLEKFTTVEAAAKRIADGYLITSTLKFPKAEGGANPEN